MLTRKSNDQPTWNFFLLFLLFTFRGYTGGTRDLRQNDVKPKIINGVLAPEGRFPYMCSIQQRTTQQHVCGGVLIGCRWVLTAAHCFISNQPGNTVSGTPLIRCGIEEREDKNTSKTFSVERLFIHEEWNGLVEDGNDIALLKLIEPTDLTFPHRDAVSSVYKDGVSFAAPGWGVLGKGEGFSDVLQVATELGFVKLSSCNNEGAWNNSIKTSMICAGHGTSGTCQGDSGGPLLMLNRNGAEGWEGGNPSLDLIVGITSFGEGVCDEHLPGIYTRVSSFQRWISKKIGDDNDCDVPPTSPEPPYPLRSPSPTANKSGTVLDDPPSIEPEIVVSPIEVPESSMEAPDTSIEVPESGLEDEERELSPRGDDTDGFSDYCGLDANGFELCLNHPFCPDYSDPPQTRMEEALEEDDTEAVQELLCCSLDVNTTLGREKYPLLIIAVRSNATEATKTLLDNGADRDGVDTDGLTALSHAVIRNSIPALEVLIACEPDLAKEDDEGRTPLHYAAVHGNLAAVKILLDHDASTSKVDYYGDTPFDLICTEAKSCSTKTIENLEKLLR